MTNPFQGHFDGGGHTVTYSVTEAEKADGLFPYLKGTEEQAAEVRELKVVIEEYSPKKDAASGALVCRTEKAVISGVSVTLNKYTAPAGGESTGGSGLAGTVEADARVENCNVKAAAGDYRNFGGVAYENAGRIENSEFLLLDGASTLGNFGGVACVSFGAIENTRAALSASEITLFFDTQRFGGVAAELKGGEITGCGSTVALLSGGANARVGGIAGTITGSAKIDQCQTAGQIFAGLETGGLVGSIEPTAVSVSITNSVSKVAEIRAQGAAGGVIAMCRMGGSIVVTDCTASTSMTAENDAGGLIGRVVYEQSGSFTLAESMSDARFVYAVTNSAGGAIGRINDYADENAQIRNTIKNCEAYADCTSEENIAGGFVGGQNCRNIPRAEQDAVYENCTAYGNAVGVAIEAAYAGGFCGYATGQNLFFRNCAASGNASSPHHAGGFAGHLDAGENIVENAVRVDSCSASGKVSGKGWAGGFAGETTYAALIGCSARGLVLGEADGYRIGGFIGDSRCSTITDCTAEGDINVETANNFTGGFLGICRDDSEIRGCIAYGNVTGNARAGGFAGQISGTADAVMRFSDCRAYGNVKAAEDFGEHFGGFFGAADSQGGTDFSNCFANGDVQGKNVGGFAGYVANGTYMFSNCGAYGTTENVYNNDLTAGGFIGWVNKTVSIGITSCFSYGKVVNFTVAVGSTGPETGGLIGYIAETKSAVISNSHSYAPQIVGPVRGNTSGTKSVGALVGTVNNTALQINQCTYTQGDVWPIIGNLYNGGTQVGEGNTAETAVPQNPKPTLSCEVTQPAGTDINVAFTAFAGITGNVQELGVSLDGGQNYTLYVYRKMPLIALPGGETVPAAPFAFTLKNTGHTGTNGVVVRVTFTDGYTRTFAF